MPEPPAFLPHYRVDVVDEHVIVLSSEREPVVLEGRYLGRLARLIDGNHTVAAIARAMRHQLDVASVEYVLALLREQGHLVTSAIAADSSKEALSDVLHRLLPLRRHRPDKASHGPAQRVTLCSDYLDRRLAGVNRRAQRDGEPWLLARPGWEMLWIGPWFTPADPRCPCWECLAQRLREHRPVDAWLARRDGRQRTVSPAPWSRASRRILREHLALHLASSRATPLRHRLLIIDLAKGSWSWHEVAKRAQCRTCGTGETTRRVLVDRITGVVREVQRTDVPRWPSMHVAMAPVATRVARDSFDSTWRREIQPPSGKGFTRRDAAASALGEALEHYSGEFDGTESTITSSLHELRDAAIDPRQCMLYSARQYARRSSPSGDDGRHTTPRPFDPNQRMDWSPVWSLTHAERRFLPTSFLYYGHPESRSHDMCRADSNGCASGVSRSGALRRALLELVERDAVAIWWYNRVQRPSLPLSILAGTRANRLVDDCHANGRNVWILDLTTDLGIPVCGAISAMRRGRDRIAFGFAADLDTKRAALRAMAELGQVLVASDDADVTDAHRNWLERATLRTDPYLSPLRGRVSPSPRRHDTRSDRQQVQAIRRHLERAGLEVFCVEQTRPDVGVPVMRAIVPGLRHFWPRFAPGRLFEVPIRLGWVQTAIPEPSLNPTPFFL